MKISDDRLIIRQNECPIIVIVLGTSGGREVFQIASSSPGKIGAYMTKINEPLRSMYLEKFRNEPLAR